MKSSYRRVIAVLVLTLALAFPALAAAADDVIVVPDVVYGHKDGLAMTFDVLRPANADGAAVIYMVSGGWVSRWTAPAASAQRFRPLLDKGFTVFVVRHGSSPKYLIPEIVADVRRAVRYIRFHARSWGVDSERMGVHGGSAGGHLSLVLATASDGGDPSADEEFMKVSNRVASVVAYYPPVDLRGMARGVNPGPSGSQRFPALNFEREKAPDYSPILHVTPDDPPTLLIHGDADELVDVSHSHRMFDTLKEHRVRAEKMILPGAAHGFRGEDARKAMAAMVAWFEKTLRN
jgi:acetyl esterase/lipase